MTEENQTERRKGKHFLSSKIIIVNVAALGLMLMESRFWESPDPTVPGYLGIGLAALNVVLRFFTSSSVTWSVKEDGEKEEA